MLLRLLLLSLASTASSLDPTHNDIALCGVRAGSRLCDPDRLFATLERYQIDNALRLMESRTRKVGHVTDDEAAVKCADHGITPALYVVKKGTSADLEAIKKEMRSSWIMDDRCHNNIYIVFSTDGYFSVTVNPSISQPYQLRWADVVRYIKEQKRHIVAGKYGDAFIDVIERIRTKAAKEYPMWSAATYPNPVEGDNGKCRLAQPDTFCDPDLSVPRRELYALRGAIKSFAKSSIGLNSSRSTEEGCRMRGHPLGIVLMRRVEGASQRELKEIAERVLDAWHVDDECQQGIILAFAVDDDLIAIVTGSNTVIDSDKLQPHIKEAGRLLVIGDNTKAVTGLLDGILSELRIAGGQPFL